jgi:hypothetical protein
MVADGLAFTEPLLVPLLPELVKGRLLLDGPAAIV